MWSQPETPAETDSQTDAWTAVLMWARAVAAAAVAADGGDGMGGWMLGEEGVWCLLVAVRAGCPSRLFAPLALS